MDAKETKKVRIKVSEDLSKKKLNVWRSVFNNEEFNQLEDIEIINGECEISILPNSIYSLTTTTGQSKGVSNNVIPKSKDFPFPYITNFDDDKVGNSAKFFSDQHGTFEVVKNPSETGNCLKQLVPVQGIEWREYDFPETIIGDLEWTDYSVSVEAMIPDTGTVKVGGRRNDFYGPGQGYSIHFNHDGQWKLYDDKNLLSSGSSKFLSGKWHTIKMTFKGKEIEVFLDEKNIVTANSQSNKNGVVFLGTDWNTALFDNLKINTIE